jgi:hypothetical protein
LWISDLADFEKKWTQYANDRQETGAIAEAAGTKKTTVKKPRAAKSSV